tara:strand:+ start:22 stop:177 length:156 start_codon:yes stop_codon:yes gene_type:complete
MNCRLGRRENHSICPSDQPDTRFPETETGEEETAEYQQFAGKTGLIVLLSM